MFKSSILLSVMALSQGFVMNPSNNLQTSTALMSTQSNEVDTRRQFFSVSSAATLGLMGVMTANPESANASGGATAGKYTTIPIAKRSVRCTCAFLFLFVSQVKTNFLLHKCTQTDDTINLFKKLIHFRIKTMQTDVTMAVSNKRYMSSSTWDQQLSRET